MAVLMDSKETSLNNDESQDTFANTTFVKNEIISTEDGVCLSNGYVNHTENISEIYLKDADHRTVIPYHIHTKLQSENDQLTQELQCLKNEKKSLQEISSKLENICLQQEKQLDTLQDNLKQCTQEKDSLQLELNKKLTELTQSVRNEEALMDRLTSLDQERMKLLDEQVTLERKYKELSKEHEKSQSGLKSHKTEVAKLKTNNEKNETIVSEQSSELKKLKADVSSLSIKLKWAQNKLKTETEGHKETKVQLVNTTKKLSQAKEESEQIRQDLKKMIVQYQESEEMKSNSLDVKLKKTEEELRQQEQEIADQQQLHQLTVKDLELNQASLELAQKECQQLKIRASELTNQISEKQDELDKLKNEIAKEKKEKKQLCNEIEAMQDMNKDIEKERQNHIALRESYTHLQKNNQHLERELSRRKDKEAELLTFSEKLSSANAQLTTEKESLRTQLSTYECDMVTLRKSSNECQQRIMELETTLHQVQDSSQKEIGKLMQSLQDKSLAVEQLTISLEEEREQILALKRKHANNIKDMQRQVQLYSKRIEQLEANNQSEIATLPISQTGSPSSSNLVGTRSISHGSLDGSMTNLHVSMLPQNRVPSPEEVSSSSITEVHPQRELFQTLDHEKTVLVEKLCQLKKLLAKKEEKLEFFEGHCHQLTEDIKGKSRLIQHFIMREEAGALVPPEADVHKAQLSRKSSSIMASVFSGSSQKPSSELSLELSLEINRKMQAVLEDTILKNITLKESLNTLGQEVARLSSQLQAFHKLNNVHFR